MNIRQLARYLNDLGVKTHRGCKFENRTIEYILNNPTYISVLRWNPSGKFNRKYHHKNIIFAKSTHEAIINQELWDKTQELLKMRKEQYSPRQHVSVKIRYWSQGLVKCGDCGKALCISTVKYYQCNGYSKGTCKRSHLVKIETLEKAVCEELKNVFENEIEINVVPKKTSSLSNEYEMLNKDLIRINDKLKRIKEAYKNGVDTLEEYKEGKESLDEERKIIEEKIKKLKNKVSKDYNENIYKRIKNVYELLTDENIPLDVKYKTAHFLINKIVFYKDTKTVEIEYK